MEKIKLEVGLPPTLYAELGDFIKQTIAEVLSERTQDIRNQRVKLTRKEFAARAHISLPTLDKHINDGTIVAGRIGRRVLIDEHELHKLTNRMNSPIVHPRSHTIA